MQHTNQSQLYRNINLHWCALSLLFFLFPHATKQIPADIQILKCLHHRGTTVVLGGKPLETHYQHPQLVVSHLLFFGYQAWVHGPLPPKKYSRVAFSSSNYLSTFFPSENDNALKSIYPYVSSSDVICISGILVSSTFTSLLTLILLVSTNFFIQDGISPSLLLLFSLFLFFFSSDGSSGLSTVSVSVKIKTN